MLTTCTPPPAGRARFFRLARSEAATSVEDWTRSMRISSRFYRITKRILPSSCCRRSSPSPREFNPSCRPWVWCEEQNAANIGDSDGPSVLPPPAAYCPSFVRSGKSPSSELPRHLAFGRSPWRADAFNFCMDPRPLPWKDVVLECNFLDCTASPYFSMIEIFPAHVAGFPDVVQSAPLLISALFFSALPVSALLIRPWRRGAPFCHRRLPRND